MAISSAEATSTSDRTIPGLIKATLADEPFVIRSDGKFVRDFLYVKDAAECYLDLGEKLAEDPSISGEAFNFSLGERLTVLEHRQHDPQNHGQTELKPVIQNIASSEIREQYLDASKARERLGWRPQLRHGRSHRRNRRLVSRTLRREKPPVLIPPMILV